MERKHTALIKVNQLQRVAKVCGCLDIPCPPQQNRPTRPT